MCIQTKVALKQLEIAIISSGLDFFFLMGFDIEGRKEKNCN